VQKGPASGKAAAQLVFALQDIILHEDPSSTPTLRVAYVEFLLSMFEKTSRKNQPEFAKDVMRKYGSKKEPDGMHSLVWCPTKIELALAEHAQSWSQMARFSVLNSQYSPT